MLKKRPAAKGSLMMGMIPAGLKINPQAERLVQEYWRRNAAAVAAFMQFKFAEQRKPLPDDHPLNWHLKVHGTNFLQGFKHAADVQREIRKALAPALDALADGELGGDAVKNLLDMFSTLEGMPYRYDWKGSEWQRRPAVSIDTLRDHWLAILAELFDSGKLNLLAHCRHCGTIFRTKGIGRYAKYCERHSQEATQERLKKSGYFRELYENKKRMGIERARRLTNQGVVGKALLAKLKLFHVGKTILRREGLWNE